MKSARICLVRHGETDWNIAQRIQGHTDIPLNAHGMMQARAVAQSLAGQTFAAIYSSDLQRAQDTARAAAAALGLEVAPEVGLRERHCGLFQGLTREECRQRHPEDYARYAARDPDFACGSGESLHALRQRVVATLERLAARHAGQSLLLITHGGVLDIVYRQAAALPLSTRRDYAIPNAALNWIEVEESNWRLLRWAERGHLESLLEMTVE